ncbi:MAG: hypothetical protein ABI367_03485 [Mucilaginibacter sp.]
MTPLKVTITITVSILLLAAINLSAQEQKTTNVQEAAIWAPDNIKVDGKLNEWNDFQALNKATQVYYTLANDGKNLYLAIRSVNLNTANKIVAGGINLTINATGKKSDKDAVVITFPTSNLGSLRNQIAPAVRQAGDAGRQQIDTELVAAVHKAAIDAAKEIKVRGIKEITDTVISVYNEYGVKAVINYNTKGNLTYELAIPLKYLQLQDGVPFAYNLKLNGIGGNNNSMPGGATFSSGLANGAVTDIDRNATNYSAGGGGAFTSAVGGTRPSDMIDLQTMMNPTDFWGKYTLAKK